MAQRPFDKLLSLLLPEESEVLDVYQDSKGYWTIGVGHLVSTDKQLTRAQASALAGAPWSHERAQEQFHRDVDLRVAELTRRQSAIVPHLTDLQWLGVMQMTFQMGVDGCLAFHDMWRALGVGNKQIAEAEALDSQWARQDSPARAKRVAAMIGDRTLS